MSGIWPGDIQCVVMLGFDVDGVSSWLHRDPNFAQLPSLMSMAEYGPSVATPRILDMLDSHSIKASFYVPGYVAETHVEMVKEISRRGHEIAHHGYLHEQPTALSLAQEIEALDRGLQALAEVAGVRPIGYRAPMWDLSWRTPELLLERGFLYDSSLMDADHPYELAVGEGSVVEIPIQWALDDWEQYCYLPDIAGSGLIESPRKAREMWQLEFDALRAAGACWVLTNHPFLSGRASRAAELGDLMRYVVGHDDVWTTSLGTIAEHVRTLNLPPRSISRPEPV